MNRIEFTVVVQTERIDRFIADQLSISRTQAGKLVADGHVTVDGVVARRSATLTRGNVIAIELEHETAPRQLERYDIPLDVAYEDDYLLVINKPASLVVHPAPGHWDDTLLNALVAHGIRLSSGESGHPGLVHRLDKDTSGLMLVAKTDASHRSLSQAIQRREVQRTYAGMVWGHIDEPTEVDAPIGRHPDDRKRMIVSARGRAARTRVFPVARFDTCDLVRVELDTGRTHQIRVHLAHIGHPLVGDVTYGYGGSRRVSGPGKRQAEQIERLVSRQALHTCVLE
ncbi:MAG: RluA family pseudouridine synthase, partial [Gemmatimonadales bacterium]